jgi:aminoglycoside 6'-N-acetyltransferase I
MNIRQLNSKEDIPYSLLLLADETEEAINKYIFNCDVFVVEQDEELIAAYALFEVDAFSVEIKNIAVSKSFQRKGIGKLILNDAVNRAALKDYKFLMVGTGDASFGQLEFYQKFGFEVFNTKNDFFVKNYKEPIFENGIQLKDMVMLRIHVDSMN